MLNVIDEFTRECLTIRIDRKLNSTAVIDVLSDLFISRGVPDHVRSDNGPEFIAKAVRDWITAVGAKTAFIDPMGERLLRELQLEAPRRAVERRDILLARRGPRGHRGMARPLQYGTATLVLGLPTTRAGGRPLAVKDRCVLYPIGACLGPEANHALRLTETMFFCVAFLLSG